MPNEGRVALDMVRRLIIEMTVNDHLPKDAVLGFLSEIWRDYRQENLLVEAGIVRDLAASLDEAVPDGPDSA